MFLDLHSFIKNVGMKLFNLNYFHLSIWAFSFLGAHINPSITMGMAVIRAISPLRAAMYITAQCGGGIAGAALLYG